MMAVVDTTPAGAAIRSKREELGITLRDLSERSGVGVTTISAIELGDSRNPSYAILSRICRALNLSLDELAQVSA